MPNKFQTESFETTISVGLIATNVTHSFTGLYGASYLTGKPVVEDRNWPSQARICGSCYSFELGTLSEQTRQERPANRSNLSVSAHLYVVVKTGLSKWSYIPREFSRQAEVFVKRKHD